LFPWLREEVGDLTAQHERIVLVLDSLGLETHVPGPPGGRGRPPEDRRAIARAFVAKAVLNLPSTTALRDRLDVDARLRRICGWERRSQVPSEATFSRAFAAFAACGLPETVHAALVEHGFDDASSATSPAMPRRSKGAKSHHRRRRSRRGAPNAAARTKTRRSAGSARTA
jgi:hypothetical protein